MGFFHKQKQAEKNMQKEATNCVEEYKKLVSEVGRIFGMAIVPISTKYGLELEIQVLQTKTLDDITKELSKWGMDRFVGVTTLKESIPNETGSPIEEGHSEGLAKNI
jgi:hypothetical protein